MRTGADSGFSASDYAVDPSQFQYNSGDVFQASFRQAANYSVGRSLLDRYHLETGFGQGEQMSVEEANTKYGLQLKPTFATKVSEEMAEYMSRKQAQSQVDQMILNGGGARPIEGFLGGAAASLTDPVEFALNLVPFTKLTSWGIMSARAGRYIAPSVVERYLATKGEQTLLNNPFIRGAVDNSLNQAVLSPIIANNSQAMNGGQYGFDEAYSDILTAGMVGGAFHTVPYVLRKFVGNSDRPIKTSVADHADPITAGMAAESDVANGKPVNINRTVNTDELRQNLADMRQAAQRAALDASAPERVLEAEEGQPIRPVDPELINNPLAQQHLGQLERRLLQVTDPEEFRQAVSTHAQNIMRNISKLAQLEALKGEDKYRATTDIFDLQSTILEDLQQLKNLDPSLATKLPDRPTELLFKNTIDSIKGAVDQFNTLAVSDLDSDHVKLETLKGVHQEISKELKRALQYQAQAETKGQGTAAKWGDKVSTLTPQLEHVTTLIKALGEDIETPELSLKTYLEAMGEDMSPELKAYLEQNPDATTTPLYRIRNNIFNKLMQRLDETKSNLANMDLLDTRPSKFPDNDTILRDVQNYLNDGTIGKDADSILEASMEAVDKNIAELKAIGIFDENSMKRFDHIQEQFKEAVAKNEAVKKGALQAQACALGGIVAEGAE